MSDRFDESSRQQEILDRLAAVEEKLDKLAQMQTVQAKNWFGYEYKSKATLFGLPLVHIAQGISPETGKLRVAKGIIAIGGIAMGGLAMGGLSLGVISIGGLALGILGFGGVAVGLLFAGGGLAVGTFAMGGLAIGYIAVGGTALGVHAFDAHNQNELREFLRHYFRPGS